MNQHLRRKLDRITNILFAGGVNNPITYIEQISYMIYLKLLDERESEIAIQKKLGSTRIKSLFPEQAKRFRWSEWKNLSGDKLVKFVRDEVFPYLASINSEHTHIAIYFRDAQMEILDPAVLKQVVDEIDEINFSKLGSDVKGDIYEYMLTYLNTMEGSLLGQFRTPRQIRKLMVEMVDPDIGDTIYDPACGTGGFLIDALEYIMAKYSGNATEVPIYGEEWLLDEYLNSLDEENKIKFKDDEFSFDNQPELRNKFLNNLKTEIPNLMTYKKGNGDKIPDWDILESSFFGVDVSRQIMRIATMNMVLHGLMKANIKRGNTLSEMGGLTEDDLYRKYKIILSNPPFAGVLPKESIRENLPKNTKKSELLFLSLILDSLAEGGTCAVVVPEGLLFGLTNAHLELRVRLVEQFQILAIISLPAGIFKPYAGVKTSIIILKKPHRDTLFENEPVTKKVWFYELGNDGYDPDKISSGGRPETPRKNEIPDLLKKWSIYKKSNFTKFQGFEANSVLEQTNQEIKDWWCSVEKMAENDYNLSARRYKPQKVTRTHEEDPTNLINEVINLEEHVIKKLKLLLVELNSNQKKNSFSSQSYPLREIITLKYGKGLPKVDRVDGDIPVYGSNGVVDYHNEAIVLHPTIIVGRKGSAGQLHLCYEPSWPIDTTFYVEINKKFINKVNLEYIYIAMQELDLKQYAIVTGVPGINKNSILSLEIIIPEIQIQEILKKYFYMLRDIESMQNSLLEKSINLSKSLLNKFLVESFNKSQK